MCDLENDLVNKFISSRTKWGRERQIFSQGPTSLQTPNFLTSNKEGAFYSKLGMSL
jgi:hypothetical protein